MDQQQSTTDTTDLPPPPDFAPPPFETPGIAGNPPASGEAGVQESESSPPENLLDTAPPPPLYDVESVKSTKSLRSKHLHPVNFIFNAGVIAALVMHIENAIAGESYAIAYIMIAAVFYLLQCMLMTCNSNSVVSHFNSMMSFESGERVFQDMIAGKPSVMHHIECYHYVTVHSGSGKNRKTRTEKRVTYRETVTCAIPQPHLDKSPPPITGMNVGYELGWFLTVTVSKTYNVADPAVTALIQSFLNDLVSRNMYRDRHFSTHTTFEIENFQSKVVVMPNENHVGLYLISKQLYMVCALLGLSWVYLMFTELVSSRVWWPCHKELGARLEA